MSTETSVLNFKQFKKDLTRGQRFQDYCCMLLWYMRKTPICNFQSHDFQKFFGENLQMEEFKYDEQSMMSENLFIETKERVSPHVDLHPAGIYAKDKPIKYTIGNYDEIWRFKRSKLVDLHRTGNYREIEVKNKETEVVTAKGFLLDKNKANEICEDKLENLSEKCMKYMPKEVQEIIKSNHKTNETTNQ
uniref:Uncharacterized protein n=1 Tax=Candidatus Kentrum sp. SD TaxID=2126332 RepID=A0A450Z7J3_9GAMM|nr:MAG: hypothetical protein BECKSD772F_GA0070984_12061 [Candidatus Kentron sp. SD]VFK49648.1 MAG: hypothetical protein BECKSD772E_GA0070983_12091 [Candidatus Kentron sp. SD]VFK81310.1 MAG: hypothetical protein BECKSD772D_GA0070982_13012 [Candidatus Kentron sp. SD]